MEEMFVQIESIKLTRQLRCAEITTFISRVGLSSLGIHIKYRKKRVEISDEKSAKRMQCL